MNPILARELRLRWRDRRSFWLLFLLTLCLCLGALWIYREQSQPRTDYSSAYGPIYRAPNGFLYYSNGIPVGNVSAETVEGRFNRTGRELFRALALGNAIAWLLIAPALTAPAIARERERGLLESLQLSQISTRSQITARYGTALVFLLALQVATLPVYSTALLLGGISPVELGASALIIAMGACTGAAIGLFFSARSPRPAGALFASLSIIAIWTFISLYYSQYIRAYPNDLYTHLTAFTHPIGLLLYLTKTPSFCGVSGCILGVRETIEVAFALQFLAMGVLLWRATKAAARQLPPPSWQGRTAWVDKWKKERELRIAQQRLARENASRGGKLEGALLADLPLDKLVRFSDPVLRREVKSRFRLRRATFFISLGRLALFVGGVCLWLWGLFSIFDVDSRRTATYYLILCIGIPGTLAIGTLAAQGFVRERESGTWEGIKLSLLRASELVRAKWSSPLVSMLYYSAPLWILIPLTVGFNGMSPECAFMSVLVLVSALAFTSALGLWISWRSKNVAASTCWTLGLVLVLWGAAPFVWENFGLEDRWVSYFAGAPQVDPYAYGGYYGYGYESSQNIEVRRWSRIWNPKAMLDLLSNSQRPDRSGYNYSYFTGSPIWNRAQPIDFWTAAEIALFHSMLISIAALVLLFDLRRRIANARETE